ncbi:MAG: N-acetylglucosamine-6-phosphate deacetylase [Verrucomicrobiaceae bacterium]|nr:N-acetylglucosamine-6-phosphate deacetylase [Verrucomicrobiaceae bacterium]
MKPLDIQVNGYAGTDFNRDDLTAEALHHACVCLVEDGCDQILATFITDTVPTLERRMRRLVELREQDALARAVIAGIHIEGPFINPEKGYVGAHPPGAVKPANLEDAKRLLDAAGGLTRIVTLAPECDEHFHVTEFLAGDGITVSAGHCNASLAQLEAAIGHGLGMFTHVGNGCPMQMHRHDNIIQRALALRDRLWLCFIPDGVHIDFFALRNYLRCAGLERTIFVTDAISAARLGPGRYTLAGWDILIGDDLVARSPDGSHFVGSTVTIPRIMSNGQQELGLSKADLARVLDENPRKAVRV